MVRWKISVLNPNSEQSYKITDKNQRTLTFNRATLNVFVGKYQIVLALKCCNTYCLCSQKTGVQKAV